MVRRWREKKVQCNLAEAGAQRLYLPAICDYGQCCAALPLLRIETADAGFYQGA
jgi:hypothetical protein